MRHSLTLVAALLAAAACAKAEPDKSPATDSTAAPAAATVPAVDTSKPAAPAKAPADTARKPASPATPKTAADSAKVETGGYDKAIKPRFKVNEKTGKIDTIRKP